MKEPSVTNNVFISKLTEIVLANLEKENFGVNDLAKLSGINIYRLGRKLQSINGKTINQLIREIRLRKALDLLHNEEFTVAEVAYKTGFGSPAYFNKCFHDFFGYSPGEARKIASNNQLSVDPDQNIVGKGPAGNSWKFNTRFPGLLILVMILGATGYLIIKRTYDKRWPQELVSSGKRVTVAVMPFSNMTNDTIWDTWQYVIQEGLMSTLSNCKELMVRQKNSVNDLIQSRGLAEYASVSPGTAGKISKILGANLFIYGSIEKAGKAVRIDVKLVNTRTSEILRSFNTGNFAGEEFAFEMIDSLSEKIKDFLLISKLIDENPLYGYYPLASTSPEALRYTIYGDRAYKKGDYQMAILWYLKSVETDSNYFDPMMGLSSAYAGMGNLEEDLRWVIKYYKKRDRFPLVDQLWASWAYAFSFEPPEEGIKYLKQLQQVDDQNPGAAYILGYTYKGLGQYDKAILEFEKSLKIYHKWGKKFLKDNSRVYSNLGACYHFTGQFIKEKRMVREAEKYNQDDQYMIARRISLALANNDTLTANRYISKFISVGKAKYSSSDADIEGSLGRIYSEETDNHFIDKAEKYYRSSLKHEPENPLRMNNLAWFLINSNRSLADVQELMDRAMERASNRVEYYNYSDTKGWGLFKEGKYQESLEILQKTWNEAPFKLFSIKSHLDEVKRTIIANRYP